MAKQAVKRKPRKKAETLPAKVNQEPVPGEIIRDLVLQGNLQKMGADEKVKYYTHLCKSLGLNPLTQPFQLITLQGKEILYATKTATEQLRKIHGISVESIVQKIENDIAITTVTVKDKSGRTDGATGAVNILNLKGDALANALMKSETKAKRRATLSIAGLGMLDETELETIPGAKPATISISTSIAESNSMSDDDIEQMKYDEAVNYIEVSQRAQQLLKMPVEMKSYPNYTEDHRKDLAMRFSRRMNELTVPKES